MELRSSQGAAEAETEILGIKRFINHCHCRHRFTNELDLFCQKYSPSALPSIYPLVSPLVEFPLCFIPPLLCWDFLTKSCGFFVVFSSSFEIQSFLPPLFKCENQDVIFCITFPSENLMGAFFNLYLRKISSYANFPIPCSLLTFLIHR